MSSRNQFSVPYYVRAAALGLSAYFVAAHLWAFILLAPKAFHRADFRQFYAGSYMIRKGQGHELYDFKAQKRIEDQTVSPEVEELQVPFVSPAYHALLLMPLTFLSYRAAYIVWLVINIVLLGLCAAMLWPWTDNLRYIYLWLPIAVMLGFRPIGTALIWGQDSILLTALMISSFIKLKEGHDIAAGALLAVGLFKFQIVIPIALLFMLWRRWKFTAGFAVVAAVLALVSVWLTGMAQAKFYINSILLMASLASHTGVAEHPIHWQWMPNVTGFLVGLFGGLGIPRFWIIGASVVVSISILVFVVRRGFTTPDDGDRFLLGVPCAVFVGYHTYLYDLSPLLLPMLVMLNRYLFFENDRSRREKWFARSAVLMFVAPIIDSYAPDYTYFAALAVVALMFAVTYAVEGRPSKPVEIGAHAVAYQENV